MNDKFDYFMCMMLENNELTLEDVAESKVSKPIKTASPKSLSTDSLGAEVEHERREVLAQFKEFNEKAKKADLGGRDAIRREIYPTLLKKMGTAWLDRLANLCEEEEEVERKSLVLKESLLNG